MASAAQGQHVAGFNAHGAWTQSPPYSMLGAHQHVQWCAARAARTGAARLARPGIFGTSFSSFRRYHIMLSATQPAGRRRIEVARPRTQGAETIGESTASDTRRRSKVCRRILRALFLSETPRLRVALLRGRRAGARSERSPSDSLAAPTPGERFATSGADAVLGADPERRDAAPTRGPAPRAPSLDYK